MVAILFLVVWAGITGPNNPATMGRPTAPSTLPTQDVKADPLVAAGVAYSDTLSGPKSYVGVYGEANISSLNIVGDSYANGTATGGRSVSIQLGASIYSSAGSYWGVVGIVLNQSTNDSFTFSVLDQVWNLTYTCAGPGTYDQMNNVSGRGGIVESFPGCLGTHYQYLSPPLGTIRPPFHVTLGQFVVESSGSFGVLFNYTLSAASHTFRGAVDTVTVYPGAKQVPAAVRVGGLTQLGFNYSVQLVLCAPIPLQVAALHNSTGVLRLVPVLSGGVSVTPDSATNYGALSLSGVEGVSVYPDTAQPNNPTAIFGPGQLYQSSLWPLSTKTQYSVTQPQAGGPILFEANYSYYYPENGSYVPLPPGVFSLDVNGTTTVLESTDGSVEYTYSPPSYGTYVLNLSYTPSLLFGSPHLSVSFGVLRLSTNITSGRAYFTVLYPSGAALNLSVPVGGAAYLLIPSGGLRIDAQTSYEYFGSGTRFGFEAWSYPGSPARYTPSIVVAEPTSLEALYGTEYLVNVTVPTMPSRPAWVAAGATVNLSAPNYIYVGANLERLVFANWSNGATTNTTTLRVDQPINISANYKVEFKVYLSTPKSVLVDTYYVNGSTLSISVPATLGGTFLYPNAFQGWSGTINSHSRTLKLKVTQPIVDQAVYRLSYARVSAIEAMAALAAGIIFGFIAQRRRL
jgi:hypothetical protein